LYQDGGANGGQIALSCAPWPVFDGWSAGRCDEAGTGLVDETGKETCNFRNLIDRSQRGV
jgi:hypothetical protein